MTERPGIDKLYGAAILVLRFRVLGWSRQTLAAKSGLSVASIYNYEKGKYVPRPEQRRKMAEALGVSLPELDRMASALRSLLLGLEGQGSLGSDRLVAAVAADFADAFLREMVPLVDRLVAVQAPAPPPAGEEAIRALAPVLARLGGQELKDLVEKLPSLHCWPFVKLVSEESERAASADAGRALDMARLALWIAERVPANAGQPTEAAEMLPELLRLQAQLGNSRQYSAACRLFQNGASGQRRSWA